MVVQRGDRGARRGGEPHSADFRGRPRDRRDADRFCRRPARADADRGRRNGGAGARRTSASTSIRWRGARSPRWRRNQEARRNELRSAARALPDADEVLALPRQRLDHAAAGLRRGLRANAQIHRVGFSRIAGRLQPASAARDMSNAGANVMPVSRCGFAPASPPISKPIKYANCAAERTRCRIRRTRASAPSALFWTGGRARSNAPRNCSRPSPIAVCSRVALPWCAMPPAIRCEPRRRSAPAWGSTSNSPTAASARVAGDAQVTPVTELAPPSPRRRRHSGGGEGQGSLF